MIKAVKDFWVMIVKPSSKWMSLHWKGYVMFNLLIYLWTIFGNTIAEFVKCFTKMFRKDRA